MDLMTLLLFLVPTILIEMGVLLLLRERRAKVLAASVGINTLTNVPLNITLAIVGSTLPNLFAGEMAVIGVEALCYRPLTGTWKQAAIYSLLCNAISFLIGLLAQLLYIYYILSL